MPFAVWPNALCTARSMLFASAWGQSRYWPRGFIGPIKRLKFRSRVAVAMLGRACLRRFSLDVCYIYEYSRVVNAIFGISKVSRNRRYQTRLGRRPGKVKLYTEKTTYFWQILSGLFRAQNRKKVSVTVLERHKKNHFYTHILEIWLRRMTFKT